MRALRGLLLLFFAILALIGLRLAPSAFGEGWIPGVSLVTALGLISCAMFQVIRAK